MWFRIIWHETFSQRNSDNYSKFPLSFSIQTQISVKKIHTYADFNIYQQNTEEIWIGGFSCFRGVYTVSYT